MNCVSLGSNKNNQYCFLTLPSQNFYYKKNELYWGALWFKERSLPERNIFFVFNTDFIYAYPFIFFYIFLIMRLFHKNSARWTTHFIAGEFFIQKKRINSSSEEIYKNSKKSLAECRFIFYAPLGKLRPDRKFSPSGDNLGLYPKYPY